MEKENFKCSNCGAPLKLEDRVCAYCGGSNQNYKKEEAKPIQTENKETSFGEEFGNMMGELFGGMMMGGLMRSIGRSLRGSRPPHTPKGRR